MTVVEEDLTAANDLLEELAVDVKKWLDRTEDALKGAISVIEQNDNRAREKVQDLKRAKQKVTAERASLDEMELRLVFAAPMSAGKSTIINAIVGEEILPHRNTAMTVFPTQIRFSQDASHAELNLSDDFVAVLNESVRKIRETVKRNDFSETFEQYPYLQRLLDKLVGPKSSLKKNIRSASAIRETLRNISDINRIAARTVPEAQPVVSFTPDMTPVVEVPASVLAEDLTGRVGSLVIVDTPGPNEEGSENLGDVLTQELNRGSMTQLILDYTQLNSEGASKIRDRITELLTYIPTENLFVLVNKIDQRRGRDDLTTEEVRSFANAHLGLEDVDLESRMYETSAIRAFAANRLLNELQKGTDADGLVNSDATEEVLKLVSPVFWEEDLEELQESSPDRIRERLERNARRLWKKSRFSGFLDGVISSLSQSVGRKLLSSSCQVGMGALDRVREMCDLRLAGLRSNAKTLEEELEALQSEKQRLVHARDDLQQKARDRLDQMTDQIRDKRSEWGPQARKMVEKRFRDLKKKRSRFKGLWSRMRGATISRNKIKFKNRSQARSAANEITSVVNSEIVNSTKKHGQRMQEELEGFQAEVQQLCDDVAEPVLERARERLEDTFDVELGTPEFDLDLLEDLDLSFSLQRESKTYTTTRTEKKKKKRWWNGYGRLPWGGKEKVKKKVKKSRTLHILPLKKLEKNALSTLDKQLDALEDALATHVEDDLHDAIEDYVSQVEAIFRRYEESLEGSLKDHKRSVEERKRIEEKLSAIASSANETRKKLGGNLETLNSRN